MTGLRDETVEVSILQIVDPAKSTTTFTPDQGQRFAALEMQIRNTGALPYDDQPVNGASLIDAGGAEWKALPFEPVEPSFGAFSLQPGEVRTGWIAFQLPTSATIVSARFIASAGLGSTAEWSVP